MRLGLGLGISRSGKTGNYFPAAKTIITAIESRKGSAMTSAQRKAIDTFIRAETAAGRWGTTIKRFFIPGWANASANAYDWVTGAVGTYSGFGAGDFTNGFTTGGTGKYFDFGTNAAGLGITLDSGLIGFLSYSRIIPVSAGGETAIGSYNSGVQWLTFDENNTQIAPSIYGGNQLIGLVNTNRTGIWTLSRTNATTALIRQRKQAGVTNYANTLAQGTLLPTRNIYAHALNQGTSTQHYNGALGACFAGLGMDATNNDAFTANLKTLWETLFGLALP